MEPLAWSWSYPFLHKWAPEPELAELLLESPRVRKRIPVLRTKITTPPLQSLLCEIFWGPHKADFFLRNAPENMSYRGHNIGVGWGNSGSRHAAHIPAPVNKTNPPERGTRGNRSFQSTKSGGGEQCLLQGCRAKARMELKIFPGDTGTAACCFGGGGVRRGSARGRAGARPCVCACALGLGLALQIRWLSFSSQMGGGCLAGSRGAGGHATASPQSGISGFDSVSFLILRGWIPRSIGSFSRNSDSQILSSRILSMRTGRSNLRSGLRSPIPPARTPCEAASPRGSVIDSL